MTLVLTFFSGITLKQDEFYCSKKNFLIPCWLKNMFPNNFKTFAGSQPPTEMKPVVQNE